MLRAENQLPYDNLPFAVFFNAFSFVLRIAKRRRKELKRSRRAPTIYAEIRQKSRQEAPLAPFQRRARREMRMLSF